MSNVLVWLAKQTLQAQQHGLNVVCGCPFVLQDIEADAAGKVDVGVVDGRLEEHCGRCIWVVRRKRKRELERQAGIGSVIRALDGGPP